MDHEITAQLPLWHDDLDYTLPDANNLHLLDLLRVEQPILHIMVMGTRTVANMSVRIGWPIPHILWQLREYKKEGIVFDREGLKSVEWFFHFSPDTNSYLDMKDWVTLQRRPGGLFSSRPVVMLDGE